ncbi:MAG TPA: hypothetical protein VHM90_16880, partial [Phycisphaerae bacterium]|nr:hypothetical protein [Phycisphaerae bacterium]
MHHLRFDQSFERRNLIRFYGLLAAGIAFSQCWPWPGFGYRIVAAAAGFVLGFGIAGILEKGAVWRYRCPKCHRRIGRSTHHFSRWDKIVIRCPRCQINWDLGIE